MVVTCDIQFEKNPEAVYYAGQVIMGKITLTADKIKQVKAVNLKINGLAQTRWRKRNLKNNSFTTYRGEQEYINTVICLLGPDATDQAVIIEPGIHTFSFVCHLPVSCLSSFEGQFGSIRYVLQVSLVRPWKFDQCFAKAFTVLAIKDLNYDSHLFELPITTDISRSFCCGPFKTNLLQISVQLPQTGFVPGQVIPVNILVTDDTKARINEICLRLVMVTTAFSSSPCERSKCEAITISELRNAPLPKNCKKPFNYLLSIPATPSSSSPGNSIIQISYRVEVDAKLHGLIYRNQCIQIPVTIGNVPLYKNGIIIQQQPTSRPLNGKNETPFLSGKMEISNDLDSSKENIEPWSAIENLPAPVYMAAAYMPHAKLPEDNSYDNGEKEFAPKYPVFDIPSPIGEQQTITDELDGHIFPPMMTDPDRTTWL